MKASMTVADVDALRSCLVQYKGGGYEGCFWEWNYAFFDPLGEFHNLLSTGRRGIESREELQEALTDTVEFKRLGAYFYQLNDPKDVSEFIENTRHDGVVMVARWLRKNWPELSLAGPCTNCAEKFPLHAAQHDSYRGAGGLSIVMCGMVCPTCVERMLETGEEDSIYEPIVPTEPCHVTDVSGEAVYR